MTHPQDASWPARIVVAVQLGIWFTVGALLLHMGITSLQLNRHISNTTQQLITDSETCTNATVSIEDIAYNGSISNNDDSNVVVSSNGSLTDCIGVVVGSSNASVAIGSVKMPSVVSTPRLTGDVPTTPPASPTSFVTGAVDSRGSAFKPSAIVMIAIGATMLIIGPFVLIFRECEVKRQKKRFTKPDPPPSYDEVTERAPRYSMLFDVNEMDEVVPINNTHPGDQDEFVPINNTHPGDQEHRIVDV